MELNPNIFWCPEAGCDQAVGMETANDRVLPIAAPDEREAQTVECGNGHLFCWFVHHQCTYIYVCSSCMWYHGIPTYTVEPHYRRHSEYETPL